jgi:hypothetical protein
MQFYITLALLIAAANAYTVVLLPDTQFYTVDAPDLFEEQTTWICNNKDLLDIVFVSHEGDIVHNNNEEPVQWDTAKRAMSILDDCSIPYSVLPGNHDSDSQGYTYYDETFPPKDNNTFPAGTNRNSYRLDEERGLLFLSLEYLWVDYQNELIQWARDVIESHPTYKVFITSHFVSGDCDDYVQNDIRSLMHDYCNVQMAFGGHVFFCNGQRTVPVVNSCGQTRYAVTANYQHRNHGGDGWLRFYEFSGTNNMCAYTYSVRRNEYETTSNAWFSIRQGLSTIGPACMTPKMEILSGYVAPEFMEMLLVTTTIVLTVFILNWASIV